MDSYLETSNGTYDVYVPIDEEYTVRIITPDKEFAFWYFSAEKNSI